MLEPSAQTPSIQLTASPRRRSTPIPVVIARILIGVQGCVTATSMAIAAVAIAGVAFMESADTWEQAKGQFGLLILLFLGILLGVVAISVALVILTFTRRRWALLALCTAEALILVVIAWTVLAAANAAPSDEVGVGPVDLLLLLLPLAVLVLLLVPSSARRFYRLEVPREGRDTKQSGDLS